MVAEGFTTVKLKVSGSIIITFLSLILLWDTQSSGYINIVLQILFQKVGRRESPAEDAAVLQKIRETVGYHINIRVDANQKWTYEQAVEFGSRAKAYSCNTLR